MGVREDGVVAAVGRSRGRPFFSAAYFVAFMKATALAVRARARGVVRIASPLLLLAGPAAAQTPAGSLLESLGEGGGVALSQYWAMVASSEARLERYWQGIAESKALRRRKQRLGEPINIDDYVRQQPPSFQEPSPAPKVLSTFKQLQPSAQTLELPALADFLRHARARYGFIPHQVSDQDFMRAYAQEAVRAGVSKEQVLAVYAVETGGRGTYSMQLGVDWRTGRGRAASTSLGYSQILCASSIGMVVEHGEAMAQRLESMATRQGLPARRAAELKTKAKHLKEMTRLAKLVPNQWDEHSKFAWTSFGLGIHALNLDGDVGPWLQVAMLEDLLRAAATAGLARPSPAQLELMNVAGPASGLEMLTPAARDVPTANFFTRNGYERNPLVQGRTAQELLDALGGRIDEGLKQPGALKFASIFDELRDARDASP
jgi:hypothetical protein